MALAYAGPVAAFGVDPGRLVRAVHHRQRGIVGDGALGEERAVAEAVEVVDAKVVAAHAKSVQGVGVADIAMCAANGDVEKAIALAEAGFDQVGGLELVAPLVLGCDLQRGHHLRWQAAVVFLDAGGYRVVQKCGLYGLAWWHQWRLGVLDVLDQAVSVIDVLCLLRTLDAAFLDHAKQCRHLFRAAAETETDNADLRVGVLPEPVFGLLAELVVRCLYAPFEGVAADAIDVTQDRVVLGEGAFDIADRKSTRLNSSH